MGNLEEDVMKKPPIFNQDGLYWMGVIKTEEGHSIARYEPSSNRVFIKNEKGNYVNAGNLLFSLDMGDGIIIPIIYRDF